MIEIAKDKKSSIFIITTTDSEGFHRQINVTKEDMDCLVEQWESIK